VSKTFVNASAYPLQWPEHWPQTKNRQDSRFDTTLFKALENVQEELQRFAKDSGKKVESLTISSNYSLNDTKPDNPGVCVYFVWDGEQTCIPVDRYRLVEDNLQAIYHCISAERTKMRHGGINLVKAAFRGYSALPSPDSSNWREILGYSGSTLEECHKAYKAKMRKAHPDKGGDATLAQRINLAWEQAQKEIGG